MCGIAGVVFKNRMADRDFLQSAIHQLAHRGPDGQGFYTADTVGLAHARLSIIDLVGGQQPLMSAHNSLALVANGEIYNYLELRETLQASGRVFASHSDCETILHSYAENPDDYLNNLRGMFAFALHDGARKQVILARDRLGIKPLFYAALPDRVVFASEIKALLPMLEQPPAIHETALAQFLQNQFSTGRETIFKGVHRVLPGEAIIIDEHLQLHHHFYWSATAIQPQDITFDQAAEQFDALMKEVMVEHMRSDVPFGLYLSGGLDSAILLGLLSKYGHGKISTYSIGYTERTSKDELSEAESIAQHFGAQHTAFRLDREAVFGHIVHAIWAADELMRDYASLPTALLSAEVGQKIKVVFTGEGGDEVFAGYGRYRSNFLSRFFKNLKHPGTQGFRTRGQFEPALAAALFGPQLQTQERAFHTAASAIWRQSPPNWSHLQKAQHADLLTALPDNLLVKADRMMMAFGIEGRVPYLDHRVVEFGLSLPDSLKVSGREGKSFLRRWAERLLPHDHIYRKKKGFHVPVASWFSGDFLDQLEAKLMSNPAIIQWFNVSALPSLFARQRQDNSATDNLFCLMQFAIWHRLFVEQPGVRPHSTEDPLAWIS